MRTTWAACGQTETARSYSNWTADRPTRTAPADSPAIVRCWSTRQRGVPVAEVVAASGTERPSDTGRRPASARTNQVAIGANMTDPIMSMCGGDHIVTSRP